MKALILCGGIGERLKPHTETVPKAMIEVNNKPLLQHVIEFLKLNRITDIVILCGYLSHVIREFFGDGSKFGVRISYSVETEKLGTAGAVNNAKRLIDDDFLLINGDVLTNFSLNEMIHEFKTREENIMALVRPFNPYGVAQVKKISSRVGKLESFIEKPKMQEWINAGYVALKKSALEIFPEKGDVEKLVYPKLQEKGQLLAYFIDDKYFWKAIDTSKDLREVNSNAGVA